MVFLKLPVLLIFKQSLNDTALVEWQDWGF